jgi:hypothetical protein
VVFIGSVFRITREYGETPKAVKIQNTNPLARGPGLATYVLR